VPLSQTFATKLRQLRESAGVSQLELATRAGMNQFTVAKLEQGQREPPLQTAQALARALGVSLSAFDAVVFGIRSCAPIVGFIGDVTNVNTIGALGVAIWTP
jgi:transcriptional regulator with XRE-family HTH domain